MHRKDIRRGSDDLIWGWDLTEQKGICFNFCNRREEMLNVVHSDNTLYRPLGVAQQAW